MAYTPLTQAQCIEFVNSLDYPESKKDDMVYQLWMDGEITLQKGGSILWQRSLHCIVPGSFSRALPNNSLKNQMISNLDVSFIWCKDMDDAERGRIAILNHIKE